MNATKVVWGDASPARRGESVVARRLGGVAYRETRGGGRWVSEIPTHHRVRSLGEGPSGFVPVDSIRTVSYTHLTLPTKA